jgi:hypothetical protein
MTTLEARGWVAAALICAIALIIIIFSARNVGAGVTCTTYGGKGPGGHRWSQTVCR